MLFFGLHQMQIFPHHANTEKIFIISYILTNHHECKDLASVSSFAWIMVAIFRKSEVRQFGLLTIQRIFFQFFFLFAAIDYLCEKLERLPNP